MSAVKSDIEIARAAKMKPIQEILGGLNMPDKAEVYSPMGRYIAKIKPEYLDTLKNKKDAQYIYDNTGIKNFLIGESLLASGEPSTLIKEILSISL